MAYSFDDASADEQRTTQYFEMFCNRGIYHQGWTAVTRHSTPWVATEMVAFDDDVWELYGPDDWSQAYDLADDQPDKLAELQRLFIMEAGKYNVLPLDDRRFERFNPDMAGRPQLVRGTSQLLFGRMGRLSENSVVTMKNKSHSITAQIDVPETGANGVIIAQGGRVRRLRALCEGRQAGVLLQPLRPAAVQGLRRGIDPCGRASGADGVHLRRRRAREGWRRQALRRRRAGRRGARRQHRADASSRPTRRRMSARTPRRRSATTTGRRTASSPAPCAGCSSTSTLPPRIRTT